MRGFLAVTGGPVAGPRFEQAQACLADDAGTLGPAYETERDRIVFAGPEDGDVAITDDGGFTVRIGRMARTRDRDVSPAELIPMIQKGDLASLVPPFAAVHRPHRAAPLTVVGDWLGFHQLFWWRGPGVVAASTSARALAALAGGGLDTGGLGIQAMIGWQIADRTPFRDVRALPPAGELTLEGGESHLRRYVPAPESSGPSPRLDDAAAEMASILRQWQSAYLADHPEAVLQLTGGHDSRILLAATPEEQRTGLRALTLGDPDSPDAEIAARLAAPFRMRHVIYRLDQQEWPTPREAHTLALTAARNLQCQASPLALAPLLLAEEHLDQGHRLSGLGGEVARGFYYGGQPRNATTSPHLIERLAAWRLFSNEAVETEALDPAFLAAARADTLDLLKTLFRPGDWRRATDEFYLLHRMHRWAGAHGTVAAERRHYVNPMFDRRFVELALAVAPDDKQNSLLLGRLMTSLDPALARIPLDSGLSPARLGTRSAVTTLALHSVAARKVALKISQRLTRSRRPQLGATEAASLVIAHWRAEPAACAGLHDIGIFNPRWLDDVLAGRRDPAPTTVAFLVAALAAL